MSPEALELLVRVPVVAELPADRREAVRARAAVSHVTHGDCVLAEGQVQDDLTLLLRGEADVLEGGRLVSLVEGPRALELSTALQGRASEAAYRADGDVTVARVPRALVLDASPGLAGALGAEIDVLRRERRALARSFDDFFGAEPGAVLVPGPYRFGSISAHFIVVETDPDRLARLLPAGLRSIPGGRGRYLVTFTQIEDAVVEHARHARSYAYHETTPFLPCVGPGGRPGMFTPELYPDSPMAILLGREIYGFPKRFARTFVREGGADVVVDDVRRMRARWSGPRAISPVELGERIGDDLLPGIFALPGATTLRSGVLSALAGGVPEFLRRTSVFVRKRIAHEAAVFRPRFDIDQLVEVPFTVEEIGDPRAWDSWSVRFAPGQEILTGKPIGVFSARLAFRFAAGVRRRDYLQPSASARAAGSRARW